MNYQEASNYLMQRLPMFQNVGGAAFKAGLERITWLCEALGNPQNQFKSIHIAGTNGKGSSSHFLASILQESGYKTGLTTSPHLKSFTERIRVNGVEIEETAFAHFVAHHQKLIEDSEASFFEVGIAMAFWYFAEKQIDIGVIETGLGGRLDATNIIKPIVSLITNIGFDHQSFLGNTLPEIAQEKAGIIKNNTPVIISEHHSETKQVFLNKAQQEKAPTYFAEDFYKILNSKISLDTLNMNVQNLSNFEEISIQSGLLGNYQLKNVLGVLKTVEILRETGVQVSEENLKNGLKNVVKNTNLKGRWQILQENPKVIADTAHNFNGIEQVLEQIRQTPHKQLHFVLGFMKDKDVNKILPLYPTEAQFYFCKPKLPRAMELTVLQEKAEQMGIKYISTEDVNMALEIAISRANDKDLILVGGSTFVVAEIKNL
jgi:dihydrofolate synthase/folylpolyglutamate synthase